MAAHRTLLGVTEIARDMNLSRGRVLQFIQEGRLKAQRLGKSYVIDAEDYRRFKKIKRRPGNPNLVS